MKYKAYLAAFAMGIMCMAVTGCGSKETVEETKETTETQAKEETAEEEEKTEEKTEEQGEAVEEAEETKEAVYKPERIISVEDVEKYVTIGEYKGLSLENPVTDITDEALELEIDKRMQGAAEEVKEGSVQSGDIARISYIGTKDGEAFEGGSDENYDLTIGSGTFIDGFEDGIVGMKAGETKDLPLTFPEEYFEESLAGQEVVFQVTLHSFKRAPELTDEWVSKNTEFATADEYRAAVKEEMEETEAQNVKNTLRSSAWTAVMSNSEVKEYPQEDIDKAISAYKAAIESMYTQGVSLEEFVTEQGMSMDDFNQQCEQYAQSVVTQDLIIQGIMDAENLSLESEEAEAIQKELIKAYGVESIDDLVAQYGLLAVNEQIALILVEDFIVENAEMAQQAEEGETVGLNVDVEAAAEYASNVSAEAVVPGGSSLPIESSEEEELEVSVQDVEDEAVDTFDTESTEYTDEGVSYDDGIDASADMESEFTD